MAPSPSPSPSPKPNNVSSMEMVLHNSNSDLVGEILLRLPVKSLVRFRSVCKEWLSLIPSLISSTESGQHSFVLVNRVFCFRLNPTSRRVTSFPDLTLQSSNGLLLLQQEWGNYKSYSVHNPVTKQSREVIIPDHCTHPQVADLLLAFDPWDYRLVCLRRSPLYSEPKVQVYSSKSHTWEELFLKRYTLRTQLIFSFDTHRQRAYWNHAIYWSSQGDPYYCCLDIAKRALKPVPCPATLLGSNNYYWVNRKKNADWRLQESNGHLYHVELARELDGCHSVAVWELDHDHHWLFRHHHVLTSTPPLRWHEAPVFIFLVDTATAGLLICWRECFRVYRLNTGSYEDFLDQTPWKSNYLAAFLFRGTLALV